METDSDGTPVVDLKQELTELKLENALLRRHLRTIVNYCDAPHWTAKRRWQVRDEANAALKVGK